MAAASLTANKTDGAAPLEVTFKGNGANGTYFGGVHLEFGDGSQQPVCVPGRGCRDFAASHTYTKPGRYVVRLRGVGEGEGTVLGTVVISVTSKH